MSVFQKAKVNFMICFWNNTTNKLTRWYIIHSRWYATARVHGEILAIRSPIGIVIEKTFVGKFVCKHQCLRREGSTPFERDVAHAIVFVPRYVP